MKKNILILQNKILHFRRAFFNELSKTYNLTIIHSGKKSIQEKDLYSELIVNEFNFFGFIFQNKILTEVSKKKYQKVIVMADLHYVYNVIAYFLVSNRRFIWWGPWFTNKFFVDNVKLFLTRKSTTIFYSDVELNRFVSSGISREKLFLANNTFDVGKRIKCYNHHIKDSILFVGTFNKRKQLNVLVNAFCNVLKKISKHINLVLIGDGDEFKNIKKLVDSLNIQKRVILTGSTNNYHTLVNFYRKAIVSVSFGQAGLSVLQAFGFGVPFITKINSISGGEKYNIKDGVNGYLCEDDIKSLEKKLIKLSNDKSLAKKLGMNAYNYYSEKCTIKKMASGFIDAIEFYD